MRKFNHYPYWPLNIKTKSLWRHCANLANNLLSKIIFSVESEGRREALLELLQRIKLRPQSQNDFSLACQQTEKYSLVLGSAERGFIYGDNQVALICESDLLGDRVIQRRRKKDRKNVTNSDAVIRNLAELKPGQPVVHIDHGIGRYLGLQTLEAGGMVSEYVMLEYQNEAKLYVPRFRH